MTALNKNKLLMLLAMLGIIYFPLFYHLDAYGLLMWDEARNAISAYEMSINGDFIIRYVDGQMDDWELKPPMLMWLQILFSKITGFNELAIRLPSAFAGLGVLIGIFFFLKNTLGIKAGIFSVLVLISSSGYIGEHVTRTGDHDSLVIFFLMTSTLIYFYYLSQAKPNGKLLLLTGLLIALGVLTKSIIGLFFLPGMLLYTLYSQKLGVLIRERYTYVAILGFLLLIVSYYFIREKFQPGYLNLVWEGELFPRYANKANRFINEDWHYYLKGFFNFRFIWISWLLPCIFFTFAWGNKTAKQFLIYILGIALVFFYIISTGSKNYWYDAPLYPLMAIMIGLGLNSLLKRMENTKLAIIISIYVVFTACFGLSYYLTIQKMLSLKNQNYGAILYKEFTDKLLNENSYNAPIKAYHNRYDATKSHLLFYSYTLPEKITYYKNITDYHIGDKVMFCDAESVKMFENYYALDTIETYKSCVMLHLKTKENIP
jgi:4-amino-4-deoxy-L-arabinose transferase-like glycosyltransferase